MRKVIPGSEAMLEKSVGAAEFMRLFSTPSRLMLLWHIAQQERSVGEIQDDLDFKQPALSQQLAELRQAGVVRTRRASRQIYYSIADNRVGVVMDMLRLMFCDPVQDGRAGGQAVTALYETKPVPIIRSTFPGEMARWARLEPAE
ncbi:ArsR/SmtB family transcription factor [Agrobacterium tumefaciens]|uniref:ArsR/SmtB family transcription factor n=1 Tax=Agrobacterium tumefaciens TaxID=358 RepID=UPI00157273FD|nr:winged helix-turn-helix transcriptional regulator [Agrobacterium tumefaciens]